MWLLLQVHRACIEREIISLLDHPFLPTLYTSFQVNIEHLSQAKTDLKCEVGARHCSSRHNLEFIKQC